jgi:hypothetical protein
MSLYGNRKASRSETVHCFFGHLDPKRWPKTCQKAAFYGGDDEYAGHTKDEMDESLKTISRNWSPQPQKRTF